MRRSWMTTAGFKKRSPNAGVDELGRDEGAAGENRTIGYA